MKGDIKYGDITSFTGVQNGLRFKVYTDQDIDINPGDKLLIDGEFKESINRTVPQTFSYKNYLLSKRIKYTIFSDDIEVVGSRFSLQNIRIRVKTYIDQSAPLSSTYIKTFILADQSGFEDDFKNDINILGISHLFAVSGLHIGLLTLALDKLLKRFIPKMHPQKVIVVVLFLYMILTSFSPSVIRAGCLYFGILINKRYKLEFSILDILSIIFLGYLNISPYAIYSLGFSLSFLVTFSIILGQYILKDKQNVKQLLIISVLAMMMALPITVSVNKEINLLTILVNVFLIYGMSFIILPLGYITFIVPFLDAVYYRFIRVYEYIIHTLAQVSVLRFDFVFVSHIQVVIYYVIVLILFGSIGRNRFHKVTIILVVFMIISGNIQIINPLQSISMIDVYGDSIFIKDSFDQCNILVDTGVPDDYDSVINFLKGKSIKRIDLLIVTHEDSDHKGERNDIYDSFNVIQEINSSNAPSSPVTCGELELFFYPYYKYYTSENNHSVVFELVIQEVTYLFTGDMEYQREEEFISLYDIDVDVLKSGHHGSITSSTERFLDDINAEEVWISCYRRNTHNHPHEEIISRYEEHEMEIYRTDLHGTIEQYFIFGKGYKIYHKP